MDRASPLYRAEINVAITWEISTVGLLCVKINVTLLAGDHGISK